MANASILAAFERMWQHIVYILGDKVDTVTLSNYYLKSEADTLHTQVLEHVDAEVAALNEAITSKANQADLETTQGLVDVNTDNISLLQSQLTNDALVIADAITGELYTLQIQNGQLVSFPVGETVGGEE